MDSSHQRGIQVLAGHDRLLRNRKVFGVMAFAIKVSARDTGGALLILEQANYKGGPPRRLHLEQEEWFYIIEGEYTVEIGGEAHHLKPGDWVLAPSFVLEGGRERAFKFINALRLFKSAVSLGGTETLCHPASTTYSGVPKEVREAVGVTEGLLRTSIGLEHPDDLIADLEVAFKAAF